MKKLIYSLCCLGMILSLSCTNDDNTNDSVTVLDRSAASVKPANPYLNVNGTSTYNEGSTDLNVYFEVSLPKGLPTPTYVSVKLQPGSTAEEDSDFTFDHQVLVPAWATSAKGKITILHDDVTESMESFSLKIGGIQPDVNINIPEAILNINITDFGLLKLSFEFNKVIPGYAPTTLCDINYDNDYYVIDQAGNDVSAAQAATSACIEKMDLDISKLKDGETYRIIQQVYDDSGLAGAGITPYFKIPVTVSYSRVNSTAAGTFVQDDINVVDSNFGNTTGYDTQKIYIASLKVENGKVIISRNGSNVGTARFSNKIILPKKKQTKFNF